MTRLLLVALGGALGSMARYGVGLGAARLFPASTWPWGTLTVNVVGGLAMGLLVGWLGLAGAGQETVRVFAAVGVLGGFTTFSAFSLETALMIERREYGLAGAYVAAVGGAGRRGPDGRTDAGPPRVRRRPVSYDPNDTAPEAPAPKGPVGAREAQILYVAEAEDGIRLDRWFRRRWPHLSNIQVQKMARGGQIRVDGARIKPEGRLTAGAAVRVPPIPEPIVRAPGEHMALTPADIAFAKSMVIYEDDLVIALNKPWGLAVQGGTKTTRHVDRLLSAWGEGMDRPRLVHRLDRDTSGVLLLGKGPEAAKRLAGAFARRQAKKTYWAIVMGMPKPNAGQIDLHLKKSGINDYEIMRPAEPQGERRRTGRDRLRPDQPRGPAGVLDGAAAVHRPDAPAASAHEGHRPSHPGRSQIRRREIDGTQRPAEAATACPPDRAGPSVGRQADRRGADQPRTARRLPAFRLRRGRGGLRSVRGREASAMTRPLAVFDIDGTLVDSRASILQAATEAARDLGLPDPDYDRVRQIVGLSLPHALAVLEPGLTPDGTGAVHRGLPGQFQPAVRLGSRGAAVSGRDGDPAAAA